MVVKDLQYYAAEDKVYWVVNRDINDHFHANDIVPCIFVERTEDASGLDVNSEEPVDLPTLGKPITYRILQFEESIKFDNYRYTAWRRFLGQVYGRYVDVLLIHDDKLYTLDGQIVRFDALERSDLVIDKQFLAKFALKH